MEHFGNIKFDRDVHQAVIDIISILGLDPKTVTAEDMSVRNSAVISWMLKMTDN